jgi:hypothetical protein
MKTVLKTGFLALAIIFSGNIMAQENTETNSNLLHYYDRELFQWDFGMFSGLTLNYQNQSSRTNYGINDSMKNALARYKDTNRQYRLYRGKTAAGNILIWGGLAAVIGGVYIPIFGDRQDYSIYGNNFKIGLGVMLGGLVSELIGSLILQSGQENIFKAVNLYNRNIISDYK